MHRLACISLFALCAIALCSGLEIESSIRVSNARVFRSDLEVDGVAIEAGEVYAVHVAGDSPFRFKVSCSDTPNVNAVVVRAVNSVRGLRTALGITNFPTASEFAWTAPVHPDFPLVVTSSDALWPSELTFYGSIFSELPQREAKMHLQVMCLSEDLNEYSMMLNDPSMAAAKEQVVAEIMNAAEPVQVSRPQAATELKDGVPVPGSLSPGSSAFYIFFPKNPGCNLSISVNPSFGDPDLYVSTHTMTPGPNNYDAKSTNFGGDSVLFTPETNDAYYVGVYSFTATGFNVMAHEQCAQQFIYLQDGVPVSDIVPIGAYALYAFNLNQSVSQLRIDMQSIVGDADLYVSVGMVPNTTFYTWSSTSFGSDTITISWPYYPGVYIIAVYGFTNFTQFSLVVTSTTAVQQLSNGVPQEGYLEPAQSTFYAASWNFDLNAGLLLHLDVLAISGDPDVYVSTSFSYPNQNNYMWKSERFLSESLTIPVNGGSCISSPCTFYIGVYAANNNATRFTITGSYNSVIRLRDGVPTSTNLPSAGESQFYALDVARTRYLNGTWTYPNVTFSIAPLFGYTNVYISCSGLPDSVNTSSFQGYIPYYQGQGSFNLDPTQYTACASKTNDTTTGTMTIYAGVFSFSGNTTYLLTASTGDAHTMLLEGVPYRGELASYQTVSFDFFNAYAGGIANVQISLTALSGDPDLFVCSPRTGHPELCNAANADYRSTRTGDDVVTVTAAPGGEYVIAVYGFSNCTFVLTLSTNTNSTSSFSVLQDGVPLTTGLAPNVFSYFEYYVQPTHPDITISFEPLMGSASAYVTTDGSIPSTMNYQFHADNGTVTIPSYIGGGQNFLIGLFSPMYSTVVITASQMSNTSMVMLSENMPFMDFANGWKYYQFYQSHNDSFVVDLTMYSGNVMVYVSRNPYPNMYNSSWQAFIGSSGQISVSKTDYNYCAYCYYFIGVQPSMSNNASYSITIYDKSASNSSIALINNMAFDDDVSAGSYKYYTFANPSYPVNMWFTILVNTYATNVTAYIAPNFLPTSNNYVYYGAGGTDKPIRVVIPQNDPSGCRPYDSSCSYFIGVFGTSNCNYTILAQAKY